MSTVEVLYEGVLFLGYKPTGRDWTQRLFVLKHHKDNNTTILEYYKDKKKRWQKQTPVGMIPLITFKLSLAHECSYKFPLKLMAGEQTYYLSATNYHAMNGWYHHIQLTQVLSKPEKGYSEYQVTVKQSESTNLIEAHGLCLLAFTPTNELVCASLPRRQVLGVWPYASLREYWSRDKVFGFVAGRRSPRGEGTFEFSTDNDKAIYGDLEKAILRLKRGEQTPVATNKSRDSDTPPVSTSSSEEEQCLPPISTNKLTKTGSVKAPSASARGSNLRRVNTHTGVPKWLSDTYNPDSPSAERHSLSPIEDTYSHTVHAYPPAKHVSPEHQGPTQTYQRLHGHEATRRESLQTLANLAEEDRLYSVAYPDSSVRIPPVSEYAVLGVPDPSRVVGHQVPVPSRELGSVPPGPPNFVPALPPRDSRALQDEELISNPMYNSQGDILKAIEKLEGSPPLLPPRNENIQDYADCGVSGLAPGYELHSLNRDKTPNSEQPASKNNTVNKDETNVQAAEDDEVFIKETTPVLVDKGNVDKTNSGMNMDPSSKAMDTGTNEGAKTTKPYSKVKKKETTPSRERSNPPDDVDGDTSREETPPPLPARMYSMDSNSSDRSNKGANEEHLTSGDVLQSEGNELLNDHEELMINPLYGSSGHSNPTS